MEEFEVVIIGAGPAGLSAAKVLAEGGKRTLVLEKNQEVGPKVCAGGLTLRDFELAIPRSLAEKIFYSIRINAFGKTFEVKCEKPLVATIGRKTLGQWMLKQIGGKVEIRTNAKVVKIKNNSVVLQNKQEIQFNYLIGADGSLSLVREYLNLPKKRVILAMQYIIPKAFSDLELFFDQKLFDSSYAWIFPYKKYTSVGCCNDLSTQNGKKIFKNFYHWLKEKHIDYSQAKLEVFLINIDCQGFEFRNKFLIGDAAGFASGLTGEGIYFAIVSGQEIAKKILNPDYKLPELKKILRLKKYHEKIAKPLIFTILKSKSLTRFLLKRFF